MSPNDVVGLILCLPSFLPPNDIPQTSKCINSIPSLLGVSELDPFMVASAGWVFYMCDNHYCASYVRLSVFGF